MKIRKLWILREAQVGFRGVYLLGMSVLYIFYGMSFINPDDQTLQTAAYLWRDRIMPHAYWGFIWVGCGAAAMINAFLRQDRIGYGVVIALALAWTFLSAVSWISGGVHNGWLAMAIWGVWAAVTINESRRGEPVHSQEVTYLDVEGQ